MTGLHKILADSGRKAKALGRGLWSEEGSIAQKSARGGVWVLAGTGTGRVLHVLQTAILARLLVPEDFGLMRLAMVAAAATGTLANFGIGPALVQRKDASRRALDTAWVMDAARNLILFGLMHLIAGPAAAFYGEPALDGLLRLVSLKFVFMAFSNNSGMASLHRDMRFRRQQTYEAILKTTATLGTVALAFWLRSVWALAWAQVYFGAAELVGSYIVHPFRPRFRFHWREARELFAYGKHFFVGGILNFLRTSLDSILLGKLLGMEALGFYTLAHSLVVMPTGLLSAAFGRVLFPAFSRLQAKKAALRRAFVRSLGMVAFGLAPMLAGIAATAVPLVRVLYGEPYAPVAPIAVAFCAIKFVRFIEGPMGSLLDSVGKPQLSNLAHVAQLSVFVPLLYALAGRHGVIGVMLALSGATLVECLVRGGFAIREAGVSLGELAVAVGRPMAMALAMGAGVWALGTLLPPVAPLMLAVMVPAGALLYFGLMMLLNRQGVGEVVGLARAAASAE